MGQNSWVLWWAMALMPQDPMSGWGSCHLAAWRCLCLEVRPQTSLTDLLPYLGLLLLQRCPVSKPNMGHQHRAQDPVTTWQAIP